MKRNTGGGKKKSLSNKRLQTETILLSVAGERKLLRTIAPKIKASLLGGRCWFFVFSDVAAWSLFSDSKLCSSLKVISEKLSVFWAFKGSPLPAQAENTQFLAPWHHHSRGSHTLPPPSRQRALAFVLVGHSHHRAWRTDPGNKQLLLDGAREKGCGEERRKSEVKSATEVAFQHGLQPRKLFNGD